MQILSTATWQRVKTFHLYGVTHDALALRLSGNTLLYITPLQLGSLELSSGNHQVQHSTTSYFDQVTFHQGIWNLGTQQFLAGVGQAGFLWQDSDMEHWKSEDYPAVLQLQQFQSSRSKNTVQAQLIFQEQVFQVQGEVRARWSPLSAHQPLKISWFGTVVDGQGQEFARLAFHTWKHLKTRLGDVMYCQLGS